MKTDAWRAVSELAASQHGCFSSSQAADLSIPSSTVRSWRTRGLVVPVHPGVLRAAAAPPTWRSQLMAATLVGDGDVVISHRAAAALHGLDGVRGDWLEATVPRNGHRRRLDGFVLHTTTTLTGDDVVVVEAIRATGLARTVCDLGAVVDQTTVGKAADDVARRRSARWVEHVLDRIERPGPSGTGTARRVLLSTDVGEVESWFERLVVEQLRRAGFGVVAQHVLRDAGGRFLARFDAAIPEVRLAIEAHSRRWHFGAGANVRDADRDARVSAVDWDVVYVRHEEATRPGAVVAKVAPAVQARRGRTAS